MLVLTRKKQESVVISAGGKTITVTVVAVEANRVRLGFQAADDVVIHRREIQDQLGPRRIGVRG